MRVYHATLECVNLYAMQECVSGEVRLGDCRCDEGSWLGSGFIDPDAQLPSNSHLDRKNLGHTPCN